MNTKSWGHLDGIQAFAICLVAASRTRTFRLNGDSGRLAGVVRKTAAYQIIYVDCENYRVLNGTYGSVISNLK